MIYVNLFLGFLKVGFFAFGGGYGAIPLIRDVVLSYGYLTDEMLTYMIAVSESTPGPIMVNLASYVGSSQAGFYGALIASIAVVLPSFIIILLVVIVLERILKNKDVQAAFQGLKPCIIGVVLATGLFMIINNTLIDVKSNLDIIKALVITITLITLMILSRQFGKKKISPIMLIVLAGILGMLVYSI